MIRDGLRLWRILSELLRSAVIASRRANLGILEEGLARVRHIIQPNRLNYHVPLQYGAVRCSLFEQTALKGGGLTREVRGTLEKGFTLIELLVMMSITTLVTIVVLGFALDFWGSSATLQNDSETLVTRANAGDILRRYVDVASGFIMQNSIADSHTMNTDPGDATGQHWLIIHAIPGTTAVGSTGTTTPLIYWQSPAIDQSHNIIFNGTTPYLNEYVLYLNGTTKELLLRTLANSYATGNTATTTCPAASASSSCPADKLVADNLSSVDMRYFSRTGNTIDYTSIVDPNTGAYIGPDFTSVEVVEFTLHLYTKSVIHGATDTSNATIIRIAIRNK